MTAVGGTTYMTTPGATDEAFPEPFITIPPSPERQKPGQLTDEQVKQYFEQGFLVVENYFDIEKELNPVRDDIKQLVDILAKKLYAAGKIKKLYTEFGVFQRLIKLEEEFPGANVILHKYGRLPPSFRALWSNERLLNIAEQLLGSSDIVGHPVWNLRTKTPKNEATTVPWHQDVAYLDTDSYKVLQPTAWIPLLDTNEYNGCMQVIREGHKSGKVLTHQCCSGSTHYVMLEEEEIVNKLGCDMKKDVVTCPIPYGGMLLMNNLIPHRSLNNLSKDVRWSLDLRWQREDQPVGFYGLKKGVLMRSSTQENLEIDWEGFDNVDRHDEMVKAENLPLDEFDASISGPWMRKWEIVNMNHHVEKLEESAGSSWHSP